MDLDPRRGSVATEFVARLPSSSGWIRSCIVERQTVSTDVQWQPRLMVLTESNILFAKPDSDVVLDKLSLKNVTFVGQVDTAQSALMDQGLSATSGRIGLSPIERLSKHRSSRRRNSVSFSTALKMERIGDLQVRPCFRPAVSGPIEAIIEVCSIRRICTKAICTLLNEHANVATSKITPRSRHAGEQPVG